MISSSTVFVGKAERLAQTKRGPRRGTEWKDIYKITLFALESLMRVIPATTESFANLITGIQ